ncbi:hypothetical protein SKAU_G00091360 [Synaphobranchus kaupii]|uniref:CNH domain-containing protein n=1 Tax=Synaphobranchus kaupii TaxID=118154 RepID=A0A9Q1J6I6_SYNKA|nr:hypothetical protein SKAU_G00091360 [Synaphobranchus kaupii]
MELLYPGKCSWVYTINNVLMSISGKASQLYSHSLKELYEQARKEPRMVQLPTHRLLPRKFTVSSKIPDTKGCRMCSVAQNSQRGCVFLCGALESPQRGAPAVVRAHAQVSCSSSTSTSHCQVPCPVQLDKINLNSNTSWFYSSGSGNTAPGSMQVNQLDSSTLLVLLEKSVHIVSLEGAPRSQKKMQTETNFSFAVEAAVFFEDTLLAVWRHGWQRRGESFSDVLQEVTDLKKAFRLVGSDRSAYPPPHSLWH